MKKNERNEIGPDRYEIDVVPNEHGGFYARIPDFPTIFTGGITPDEAMRNALEAIGLMIEEYRDRGMPVPQPLKSFSGTFNVRLPKSVHRELVRRADRQGVSLNAMVGFLLAQAVGFERGGLDTQATAARRKPARGGTHPEESGRRRSRRAQPGQAATD
jgi:predicted RNase H-like HicB family nuclease